MYYSWQDFLTNTAFTVDQYRQFCRRNLNGDVNTAIQPFVVAYDAVPLLHLLYCLFIHNLSLSNNFSSSCLNKIVTKLAIIFHTTMTFCQF